MISLSELKAAGKEISGSAAASLIDLGDGCACLEFHSKMNTFSPELVAFMVDAHHRCVREFRCLVIGNQGEHFSAGYDLAEFLDRAEARDWNGLDSLLGDLQNAVMQLKYSPIPVVAATFGYTLGGGCECLLHCASVQAAEDSIIGLPEPRIGVLPAGGATKELLARFTNTSAPADLFANVERAYAAIVMHGNSRGAREAESIGLLRASDGISASRQTLIDDAKKRALALADAGYDAPRRRQLPALGSDAYRMLLDGIDARLGVGAVSEHDALIARKVAWVLTGGAPQGTRDVAESYVLDLEREGFIELLKTPKSLARMRFTLETGKHLRN
jgi:3-hydroxyacyl-CoA dehydrogenase